MTGRPSPFLRSPPALTMRTVPQALPPGWTVSWSSRSIAGRWSTFSPGWVPQARLRREQAHSLQATCSTW